MSFRRHENFLFTSSIALILLIATLLCGCTGTNFNINGYNSGMNTTMSPETTQVHPNNTPFENNITAAHPVATSSGQPSQEQLNSAWKTLRIINTDTNERYMMLDLSKSDDKNYLREVVVPEAIQRIEILKSDLNKIKTVNDEERNETEILIEITNYTILKYEGLSTLWHATQYVSIGDPVKMKTELRKAKFQIMDAIDIINKREISEYPSMYRDQVAADKRELDDMASQIESYTRSVYLAPVI
jgi:hypothetical protein